MGIRSWIIKQLAPAAAPAEQPRRDFAAAAYSRLTASLASESDHIMRILKSQGRTLRARSRQLADNNCYVVKFISMVLDNVCGPKPFQLQAKIKSSRRKMDVLSNERIEREWKLWGRPGQCDITGRMSWADLQKLILRTIVVDGECLLRVMEGSEYGPWGLQLQLIDTDRLDEDKNENLPNGNTVIAGVEVDRVGRTVAYWFLKNPPRYWTMGGVAREYIRVPADQVVHLFIPTRAEQLRGVPWIYAALVNIYNMGAFDEAAIIAARVGASKMGFFTSPDGLPPAGIANGMDSATGALTQNAEPGSFDTLPNGYSFQAFDPAFPDAMVEPFKKAMLRGTASGLSVSYPSLGNDAEAVNFSSLRAFLLEERNHWMCIQEWLVEHLHDQLYERWLMTSSLSGRVPLQGPLTKYLDVTWRPKRWQWVDPLKDVQANIEAIKWALKSRTEVVAETGGDLEDIMDQLAAENRMAEERDIEIDGDATEKEEPEEPEEPASGTAAGMEDDDESEDDTDE